MNLRANPYIGEYTNEELQEWVKELQDECVKMSVSNDLLERMNSNNNTIHDAQARMLDVKDEMLKAKDAQIDLLKNVIDRHERAPINRTTLAAFSTN